MSAPFWPIAEPIGDATRGVAWLVVAFAGVWVVARASGMFTRGACFTAAAVSLAFAWGGGWGGVTLYVALFGLVAWASAHRADEKAADWSAVGATGPRTSIQILAKTAVGALLAFAPGIGGNPLAFIAFAAAPVAVAVADTWSSELGILYGHAPKLLLSRLPVAPGRSGGTTSSGTIWGILGAGFVGCGVFFLLLVDSGFRNGTDHVQVGAALAAGSAAVVAGIAGMFADSLLGETVQGRWRCAVCKALVETPQHCNEPAAHQAGLPFLRNAGVNFMGSVAGTVVGLLVLHLLSAL